MKRYVCIHGHFYQPPRENPWLEAVELQESAHPFHDWNERIDAECYNPNASARILDGSGQIQRIVSNYEKMSFNFGPTLLSWMEEKAPETYQAILEADLESQRTFSGHGSALAQAYNHMILPLANSRDKKTQVIWGIRDFEHRFRRKPEGIWFPETAVDLESLDLASECGIKFTILSPHQARRTRRIGETAWTEHRDRGVDPTHAYEMKLPSGRTLAVFFYDGPISQAIAFENLLRSGEAFAGRLMGAFPAGNAGPQLVHVATDGETYGHHHRFGDMALAYALQHINSHNLADITNYGQFLERHPPAHEAEITEGSSWSCSHGVERWRRGCGCNSGGNPGWKQDWRTPLRDALDWLRDYVAPHFEREGQTLFAKPWTTRDEYIEVILDRHRSSERVGNFLARHAKRPLSPMEQTAALKLLEMQRHAMLMYTSCGWFFDDISGIETIQILRYAGRVVQLTREITGEALESRFVAILESAKSNVPQEGTGRRIYERWVKPGVVGFEQAAARYAVRSLFDPMEEENDVSCYTVRRGDYISRDAGTARLTLGQANIRSRLTFDQSRVCFGALRFGDYNITGGVRSGTADEAFTLLKRELSDAFERGDFPEVVRLFDKHFGKSVYSLRSLSQDEQRRIMDRVLENSLAETESVYRRLYQSRAPLIRFMTDLRIPLPEALRATASVVLNADLRTAFASEELDFSRIEALLANARSAGVVLDRASLARALEKKLESMIEQLFENPTDLPLLEKLSAGVSLSQSLGFDVNLRRVQNYYYEMYNWVYPEMRNGVNQPEVSRWLALFVPLGKKLGIRID